MTARFSRVSAVGVILATTFAFEGCAPFHLAWERERTFGVEPARLVAEQNTIVVQWIEGSDTHARFVAHALTIWTYERDMCGNRRRLVIHGESWTVTSLLLFLAILGAGGPAGDGTANSSGEALVSFLAFASGIVGLCIATEILWFLLSVPPAIREGIVDSAADGTPGTLTYTIEEVHACGSLTLADPMTGARLDLVTVEDSGAVIDAATLRAVGFRSARLEVSSGSFHALVPLPRKFARSLGAP